MDDGVNGLINQLCEVHLGPEQRAYVSQPKLSHQQKKFRLRKTAWNNLFLYLKGPHRRQNLRSNKHVIPDVSMMYALAFEMRQRRLFDEANRLEQLVGQLTKDGLSENLCHVFKLLLRLSNIKDVEKYCMVGHDTRKLPVIGPDKNLQKVLPDGPLCYGDTCFQRKDDPYFMHYPREIFEVDGVSIVHQGSPLYEIMDPQVFFEKPGNGLAGNGIFNIRGTLEDSYEKHVRETLFGALTHSRTTTMDIVLDLPDIQHTWDKQVLELRVPKGNESVEDEGFVDRTPSVITSSSGTPLDTSGLEETEEEDDLWDLALKYKPTTYRTWENRGRPVSTVEKPYLSEAGPQAFDEVCQLHQFQLCILDPNLTVVNFRKVTMAVIVRDAINMLIGVPSKIFTLDQENFKFVMTPGVYITGTSPEGLADACSPLMTCGTQYVRLAEFSRPLVMDSRYSAGLVFQAFSGGVRKYLQHYRASVLSLHGSKTLLQLTMLVTRLSDQIRLLAQICRCEKSWQVPSPLSETSDSFPTGVALLSYLYEETLDASASIHYPMLLSLMNTSCSPYIMFVRDWVFEGVCRDVYGEFMIQMNEDYLRFRDKHYWTHGYILVAQKSEEAVPLFLQEMANDIFVCGKAINLLRLVEPEHFLFSLEGETPGVSITFSEEELYSIEKQCKIYLSRMQQIARQHRQSRVERLRQEEQAKQDVMIEARRVAMMANRRYQALRRAVRKAEDNKKRAAFQELKEQMEKDLLRRASAREQEREEDAARVAATTRQELLEATVEEELEKKARADMVEHYAQLTAEAAYREKRALWKVARHHLETRRIEFLTREEDLLLEELSMNPLPRLLSASPKEPFQDIAVGDGDDIADLPDGEDKGIQVRLGDTQSLVDVKTPEVYPSDDLPKWARKETKEDPLGGTVRTLEGGLPSWAKDGLKNPKPPFGLEQLEEDRMPGWARNLSKSETPLIVCDETDKGTVDASQKAQESTEVGQVLIKKSVSWSQQTEEQPARQAVKHVEAAHVSQETEDTSAEVGTTVKIVPGMSSSQESSQESEPIPRKKTVKGQNASVQSTETFEDVQKGRKTSSTVNPSQESSQEVNLVQRKKTVTGQHVSIESKPEVAIRPTVKMSTTMHATKESEPAVLKPTGRRGIKSHVSQVSLYDFNNLGPVQRHKEIPVYMDPDFGCYQIKPHRKSAVDTTDSNQRTAIGMSRKHFATRESEFVNMDALRTKRFKATNVHGHSSDSTVQRLLYGENFGSTKIVKSLSEEEDHKNYTLEPWSSSTLQTYSEGFEVIDEPPVVDLMSTIQTGTYTDTGDYGISTSANIEAHTFVSLTALLRRSVTGPLQAQIQLVNQCLRSYYFQELQIEAHFVALRRFLLMQDGEFGQSLSDQLFEKLATNPMPHEMLNPMYLNNVLSRALRSSIHGDTDHASQVNFALKFIPSTLQHHAPNALNCLELTYKVDWPLNVVITDTGLSKYSHVFSFMLQLKRAVWVLKDVWHRLKRDAIIHNASTSSQFRKLQLYRHEMTHFVKVMQGYIANQVIHVTWREFQENLAQVETLDDLHHYHSDYLAKCIFRCLLNKKAGPVMKIIEDIFALILKFRTQLVSHEWQYSHESKSVGHGAFDKMCAVHKAFEDYTRFLFKVVNKLAMRGYQPHLQELLLRLNFNSFYNEQ